MSETEITFYGKRLPLRRAPFAMRPGEEPDMIVSMSSVLMMCPLGLFSEQDGLVRTCGGLIQMPLELTPSAFICPWCFSLLFIDENQNAGRYYDADLQGTVKDPFSLFGYATYPNHAAQQELHTRIEYFTSGHGVLVATRYKDEGKQMFGITEGRYVVSSLAYTQADLESSLPKPSDLAVSICRVAFTAYQAGCYIEAIGMAQRALVVEQEHAQAHFLIGTASDELELFNDAVHAYQAALRISPDLAEAHGNLGVVYEKQGQLDNAIQEYQAALVANPNLAEAHYNLGQIYLQRHHWNEAIREYQAALHINQNYAEAYHNLGVIYRQLGRFDDAIRAFQAALRITPNDAQTHCNLGIIYWEQRRVGEAIREWQIAVRLGYQPAREWLVRAGLV